MPRPLDAEGRAAVDALLSLAERGFPQGARKTRARTARLDGAVEAMGAVLAWAGGNRERLAAALGALEPLPGGPWDWIAELAEELILDGRIDEAAAITYSVASPLEDECLSGDFALALASFGPRERAVAAIETCLKHFPHGPLAALTCAEAWLELEEPARAEPLLRRVLDLSTRGVLRDDPELAEDLRRDSLSILLPLLLGEGREDEARTVYRRHAGSPVLRRSAIVVPIDAPRTGRNEPCPCGSGRKFKHCCGSLAAPATAPNVSELIGTVSAFGRLAALPEFGDDARQAYFGEGPPMLGDDSEVAAFIEWRTLDLPDATGRTALRRFAEWYADELDGPTCALLDALDRSQVRLYEVCAIRPGEGFTLLDLLDGRTAEIRERPGSRQVQPWDLLAARRG